MADQTKKELRNLLMYQIFVRNYSEEGTFSAVMQDLDRIRDLGVDIIYLLPVHPIGLKCRKGTLPLMALRWATRAMSWAS